MVNFLTKDLFLVGLRNPSWIQLGKGLANEELFTFIKQQASLASQVI
jgi:hypothetical protein